VKIVWLKDADWISRSLEPGQLVAYQIIGQTGHNAWRCMPNYKDVEDWYIEGSIDAMGIERVRTLKNSLGDHLVAVERQGPALIVYWKESADLYPDVYRYLFPDL
jgi:hypothetical protein